VFAKNFHVFNFESEMGQVRLNLNRPAGWKMTDFNFFSTSGGFKKDKFGASWRFVSPYFFKTQHFFVKIGCLFQIGNPVAGVEKAFNHRSGDYQRILT
jgi:hypothetical protein